MIFNWNFVFQLQRHLHEDVLDQIAPLIELKRWLSYLNISPAMSSSKSCPVHVEVIPQVPRYFFSYFFVDYEILQN
jgi:hypothetical protein